MLYVGAMESHTFLYRCPTTGHKVQGLLHGRARCADDTATYETVTCLACNGVHLVNPRSGRIIGAEIMPDE
jgi:hypothetical protein